MIVPPQGLCVPEGIWVAPVVFGMDVALIMMWCGLLPRLDLWVYGHGCSCSIGPPDRPVE